MTKPDIEFLINSPNINNSIIQLDNYICELCGWGETLSNLNQAQQILYFNQNLEREVNNGGFNIYFLNSAGNFAHETIKSLQAIGANHTAELLQQAIDEFPASKVPTDRSSRQKLVMQFSKEVKDKWHDLDNKFFEYKDDLNSLNMDYVKDNKKLF